MFDRSLVISEAVGQEIGELDPEVMVDVLPSLASAAYRTAGPERRAAVRILPPPPAGFTHSRSRPHGPDRCAPFQPQPLSL